MKKKIKNIISLVGQVLLHLAEGLVLGIASLLPGVSSGVLAMSFGLYHPFISTLTHPREYLAGTWSMLLPAGLGLAAGFMGAAGLIGQFYQQAPTLCTCTILGLVSGGFPSLFSSMETPHKNQRRSWLAFTLVFVFCGSFMAVLSSNGQPQLSDSVLWMYLCGILMGCATIIPGLTVSPVILWLGLYERLTQGIAALDIRVLIPYVLGIATTVFFFSRLVMRLFDRHGAEANHAVMALAIVSTYALFPKSFASLGQALLCALCFAAAFCLALGLDRLRRKYKDS